MPDRANLSTAQSRVRGWLLALCLMLTVVGPVISVWLMAEEYTTFANASGSQLAILFSQALTTFSVAFGVYAGLRLWTIKPKAVNIAKSSLLFGLATDVITTGISVAVAPTSWPDAHFLGQTLFHALPGLIFFTVCFAYLNRSERVFATFYRHATDV